VIWQSTGASSWPSPYRPRPTVSKRGEPVTDALRKCPGLILVPPNYSLYEKNSNAFIVILREYSDVAEQYSVDEAFVDMTGRERLFGSPVIAKTKIKDRIHEELGFTVNIWISSNKLLAKWHRILKNLIKSIPCFHTKLRKSYGPFR